MSDFNEQQFVDKLKANLDKVYDGRGNENNNILKYIASISFWHKATTDETAARQYLSDLLLKYPISLIGDYLIHPRTVAAIWRAVYKGRRPYEQLEIEAENVPSPLSS